MRTGSHRGSAARARRSTATAPVPTHAPGVRRPGRRARVPRRRDRAAASCGVPHAEMACSTGSTRARPTTSRRCTTPGSRSRSAGGGFLARPALPWSAASSSTRRRPDRRDGRAPARRRRLRASPRFVRSDARAAHPQDLARLLDLAAAFDDGERTLREFAATSATASTESSNVTPCASHLPPRQGSMGRRLPAPLEQRELPFYRPRGRNVAEERRCSTSPHARPLVPASRTRRKRSQFLTSSAARTPRLPTEKPRQPSEPSVRPRCATTPGGRSSRVTDNGRVSTRPPIEERFPRPSVMGVSTSRPTRSPTAACTSIPAPRSRRRGGCSTTARRSSTWAASRRGPGADGVSADEELRRVVPCSRARRARRSRSTRRRPRSRGGRSRSAPSSSTT